MNQRGFVKDIIIIILGVVIIAGGYFYFSKKPVNAPAETLNQNQSTNWQTYKSDKFGFEFKYPPNYKISELRGGEVGMSLESEYAFIDFVDSQEQYDPSDPGNKKIFVNGMEGVESGLSGNMDGGVALEVRFRSSKTRNGYLGITLSTRSKGYELKIDEFKKIIATFKFTK